MLVFTGMTLRKIWNKLKPLKFLRLELEKEKELRSTKSKQKQSEQAINIRCKSRAQTQFDFNATLKFRICAGIRFGQNFGSCHITKKKHLCFNAFLGNLLKELKSFVKK